DRLGPILPGHRDEEARREDAVAVHPYELLRGQTVSSHQQDLDPGPRLDGPDLAGGDGGPEEQDPAKANGHDGPHADPHQPAAGPAPPGVPRAGLARPDG